MTTITTPAITLEDVLRALMETQAMMEKTLVVAFYELIPPCKGLGVASNLLIFNRLVH